MPLRRRNDGRMMFRWHGMRNDVYLRHIVEDLLRKALFSRVKRGDWRKR